MKQPRSLTEPCKGCHWRLHETCTFNINPVGITCGLWWPEKKEKKKNGRE
jgi:hypothetical protein